MKNLCIYEQLKSMLDYDNFNISEFSENNESDFFTIETYVEDYYLTINQEGNKLELVIEKYNTIEEEYYVIEKRYYKTAKGAYNKIVDLIRE